MAIHPGYGASSFDCLLQSLMQRKRKLASQALWPMGDTKSDLASLQSEMVNGSRVNSDDVLSQSMQEMFERDGLPDPKPNEAGAYLMG